MKGFMRFLSIVIVGLLACPVAYAGTDTLAEELIEADAIGADSEAAIIEAEELKDVLAEEKAEEKRLREQLEQEKEAAEMRRVRAENKIKDNEGKIAATKKRSAKMRKEMAKIKAEQEKLRLKQEKTQAKLEVLQGQETQVKDELARDQGDLRKMRRDHRDMKNRARKTATKVSAIRKDVKRARVQIAKTYRNMKKDSQEYKNMIAIYRKSLEKADKMLYELEMAVEVDQAYDQRLAEIGKLKPGHRTVSGLNKNRVATITSKHCNLRAFPSTKSAVLDKYPRGKKVNMKHHSRTWYTVIHGGEKAFMGKACFN